MHTARRYQMPANNDLCRWLGVPASASDALTADDLSSPKKIRQATHRALFQRRPGQYPRRWLAARLGVSARTTQRYDTALKVQVKAMFHETTITWKTLNRIPDFPLDGTFLQDENGKRYPARQPIAAALLQAGRTVIYARQDANFYSLDAPQVVTVQVFARQRHWQAKQEQIEARVAAEQSRIADLPKPPAPVRQPRANLPDPEPAPEATQTKPSDRRSPRRFRYPLPEATQEALAQRVYNALNARVREAKQRISQATVRRCVETHGCTAVEGALKFTLTRRALRQPAGFFLTVLRTGKRG